VTPLSPLLFNLVADVLASMMNKTSRKGKLKGVMGHLILEGITHIQYVDDTILMVEGDDDSVRNMKFILYYFEWLSGLKINSQKSEAFIFGCEDQEKRRIANMLNCQLGVLPMEYLGIPISDVKLDMGAFNGLGDKVAKRVPSWKGRHMSSRGRLILTNKCLTSLPTYTMGFYSLPPRTHKKNGYCEVQIFLEGGWRGFQVSHCEMGYSV
jgi:hypothetical protein